MSQHYHPDHKPAVDALLLALPDVSTGQMFGHPSYKIAGKMFAALMLEGIILKLPKETISDLLQRENVSSFAPGGTPMTGWVLIEIATPEGYAAYQSYYVQALEYVAAEAAKKPKKKK
ncbi:MAG: MmcQ/YjbR family DNA-binding protein [Chloroflexi bacterium]|nr:MmcQ/YjbR family DNA-binding protein [Chloroflexota bacterium]